MYASNAADLKAKIWIYLTESDIFNGRSEVRNRVVARVFKFLNYIEQWGTGIKRIQSSCLKQGLKEPTIKEMGDFVEVTMYRKIVDEQPENQQPFFYITVNRE